MISSRNEPNINRNNLFSKTLPGLSWRMDPDQSFSDWTLIVKTTDIDGSASETTYHVHKQMLAFGPRAGDYFATLFANNRLRESLESRSVMNLEAGEARAVPHLLDFVYFGDANDGEELTEPLAIDLLRLADYFSMPALQKVIWEFVQHKCLVRRRVLESGMHLPLRFYEMADTAGDETILRKAKQCCTHQFTIGGDASVDDAMKLPPDIFKDAFVEKYSNPFRTSGTSWQILTSYLRDRIEDINLTFFIGLLDHFQNNPLALIHLLREIIDLAVQNKSKRFLLSKVNVRCKQQIVRNWDQLGQETIKTAFAKLPDEVKLDIHSKVLEQAVQDKKSFTLCDQRSMQTPNRRRAASKITVHYDPVSQCYILPDGAGNERKRRRLYFVEDDN